MHMAGRVNLLITPEVHSEPSQTSKMELFAKIANGWKLLTILQKALFYMFDWVVNMPLDPRSPSHQPEHI